MLATSLSEWSYEAQKYNDGIRATVPSLGVRKAGTRPAAQAYYVPSETHGGRTILAPARHQRLLENARQLAKLAAEAARHGDTSQQMSEGVLRALHRSGLATAPFGEAQGGVGLAQPEHQGHLCSILRILGGADLSLARLFEGHVNAVHLVAQYGTQEQIERLAHDVKGGELSGVWAAEDADGLKRNLQANEWLLEGNKILASGAGFVRRPLITVAAEEGVFLYLVSLPANERVDISRWQPLGPPRRAPSILLVPS